MSQITMTVCDGFWGDWAPEVTAPNGCYLNGVRVRYEAPINGDDTAMNGLEMNYISLPGSGSISHSTVVHPGHWGDWRNWAYVPNGYYVIGFRTRLEAPQGDGDDTALNGLEMLCKNFNSNDITRIMIEPGNWGGWGPDIIAPPGYGVVGLQARVEAPVGNGDDTAMNGIRMICRSLVG